MNKQRQDPIYIQKQRIAEELKINTEDLLTPKEADIYLGLSQTSRYRYCQEHNIKKRFGGGKFYHKKDFADYFIQN